MPRACRIVSISPSNTEILHALGLGRRIVGVDDWSDYPPRVKQLPKLGSDLHVDIERVVALQPDVVVASLHVPGMEANIPSFEAAGLAYIAVGGQGLDGVWQDVRAIGTLLGRAERADALVEHIQQRMRAVAARCAATSTRPRVHWEWSAHPVVAGPRSWISEMLELVGAENAYRDLDVESARLTPDDVVMRDPDVVVACWCGARKLPTVDRIRQRWDGRLRDKPTAVFAEDLFGRPGPRLADGLERLAALLHPEATVSRGGGKGTPI
jgi:iron complex transport system substrate-binding protein